MTDGAHINTWREGVKDGEASMHKDNGGKALQKLNDDWLLVAIIPKWIPQEVRRVVMPSLVSIGATVQNDEEKEVWTRLMTSPQMKSVWRQLLSEDSQTGVFRYPVTGGEIAQYKSVVLLMHQAFCSARDKRQAYKYSEVETEAAKERERLLAESKMLRRRAVESAAAALINPAMNAQVAALLREAEVSEEQSRRALAKVMSPDDPMIIQNDRGDRFVMGVATDIAAAMWKIYRKMPRGIVRILTEVALDKSVSDREARTAVSRIPQL
jgi:hypothetical protein